MAFAGGADLRPGIVNTPPKTCLKCAAAAAIDISAFKRPEKFRERKSSLYGIMHVFVPQTNETLPAARNCAASLFESS